MVRVQSWRKLRGDPAKQLLGGDGLLDVKDDAILHQAVEPVQLDAVPFDGYPPQLILQTDSPDSLGGDAPYEIDER